MVFGSMPNDGGNLVLAPNETSSIAREIPAASRFIKRYMGSEEFINDGERYCLWITDETTPSAAAIPPIARTARAGRSRRRNDSDRSTHRGVCGTTVPVQADRYKPTDSIIVPSISSERREYIPMGYLGPEYRDLEHSASPSMTPSRGCSRC